MNLFFLKIFSIVIKDKISIPIRRIPAKIIPCIETEGNKRPGLAVPITPKRNKAKRVGTPCIIKLDA